MEPVAKEIATSKSLRQEHAPPILGTFQKPMWLKEEVKWPYGGRITFKNGPPTVQTA